MQLETQSTDQVQEVTPSRSGVMFKTKNEQASTVILYIMYKVYTQLNLKVKKLLKVCVQEEYSRQLDTQKLKGTSS